MADIIHIVVAVIANIDNRILLVRKRGTTAFMQPGGKIESGESPIEALHRELTEELTVGFDPASAVPLGRFQAVAANEAGRLIDALVFRVTLNGPIMIAAEIEAFAWLDPDGPDGIELAPLTRDFILPLMRRGATA